MSNIRGIVKSAGKIMRQDTGTGSGVDINRQVLMVP
jgi:hypothetical protein